VTNRGAMPSSETRTTGGFDNPTTSEETTAGHRARTLGHYRSGTGRRRLEPGAGIEPATTLKTRSRRRPVGYYRWSGQAHRLGMKHVGCEIRPIRPDDRPQLLVDADLREVADLAERFEYRPNRTGEAVGEINVANKTIGKCQPKTVPVEVLDGSDLIRGAHDNGSILGNGS